MAAVLTMAVLVATSPAAALAAGPDPFTGSYRAIDTSFDNSNMLLAFGGPDQPPTAGPGPEGIRRVVWIDDAGTVCGGDRFFAEGIGFIDGDTILVIIEVYCGNAGNLIGEDVVEFTADASAGKLTDSYGVVWSRP
jgi:hypothetical protein